MTSYLTFTLLIPLQIFYYSIALMGGDLEIIHIASLGLDFLCYLVLILSYKKPILAHLLGFLYMISSSMRLCHILIADENVFLPS